MGRSYKFPEWVRIWGKSGDGPVWLDLSDGVDAVSFVVEKWAVLGKRTFDRVTFRRVTDEMSGTRFEERERCAMTKEEIGEWRKTNKRLGIRQS